MRGVVWRQLLRFAILNVPPWIEPIVMAFWSAFFLLWGPGRRGVMRNLKVIKPGSLADREFLPLLPRLLELRVDDRRQRPLQGAAHDSRLGVHRLGSFSGDAGAATARFS